MLKRAIRLNHFTRDESGAIAPLYGIAIFTLVGIAGVGFDYARMAGLDSELQNAADQAALAGASQLDGNAANGTTPGACARAANAIRNFVANNTRFANDGGAARITFQNEAACDATGSIRFWQDSNGTVAAATDAQARFVEVFVDRRQVRYSLTPLVDAFSSGPMGAAAMAGLGSAVCKVPPIMICNPDPNVAFNADGRRGQGIVATGHSVGNSSNQGGNAGTGSNNTWAPGDFGFLQIQDGNAGSRNQKLLRALAYANPPLDCTRVDGNKVNPGNPQGLYDAINTRFDIYDFPSNGNGNVLAGCKGGLCPPAPNVTKDFTGGGVNNGNNACKIQNQGWRLPASGQEFKPVYVAGATASTQISANTPAAMGLPRDNCHYTSYNGTGTCPTGNGRFGDGVWARADYFVKNHTAGGVTSYPPSWQTISRYDTYKWELNGNLPANGAPVCAAAGGPERRVMTLAVVNNCAALSGSSTDVDIGEWVDVFLVEPSTDDARRYNTYKDAVYFEIIGKSKIAGNGVYGSQEVRRDVPYLVR